MTITSESNRKYVQKRTKRAWGRARFVGVLYFLGTLALAVLAFLPVIGEISFSYGALGLTTFWKPFTELGLLLSGETRVGAAANLVLAVLYALPLLVCVLSAFCSLSKLDNLFMKGNRRIGYNQSYLALNKMANTFSASYAAISVCSMCLIFLTGTGWTYLFYFASAGFLALHFFCGLIGGTVSRFSLEEGFVETPRKYGLWSVFFRNLIQFTAVTAILSFFVKVNVIPAVFIYLEDGFFANVSSMTFEEMAGYLVFPISEVIMLLCTIIILRHACNPTEFALDGPNAKGRKTVRVASFLLMLFSLVINGCLFYLAEEKTFDALSKELLYISGIALGLFIFECLLKKFPLMKKKYKTQADPEPIPLEDLEASPVKEAPAPTPAAMPVYFPPCYAFAQMQMQPAPAPAATPEPAPAKAVAPVFEGLRQGGIYIQPDGSQVMVLPIVGNAAMAKPEPQPMRRMPTEHEKHVRSVTDKWIAAASEKPVNGGFSSAAYVQEKRGGLGYQEPAPTPVAVEKEWRIRCPQCNALHSVTKTGGTVTCKKCGEKFDIHKWIKV